jgi:hypothetical protein
MEEFTWSSTFMTLQSTRLDLGGGPQVGSPLAAITGTGDGPGVILRRSAVNRNCTHLGHVRRDVDELVDELRGAPPAPTHP